MNAKAISLEKKDSIQETSQSANTRRALWICLFAGEAFRKINKFFLHRNGRADFSTSKTDNLAGSERVSAD